MFTTSIAGSAPKSASINTTTLHIFLQSMYQPYNRAMSNVYTGNKFRKRKTTASLIGRLFQSLIPCFKKTGWLMSCLMRIYMFLQTGWIMLDLMHIYIFLQSVHQPHTRARARPYTGNKFRKRKTTASLVGRLFQSSIRCFKKNGCLMSHLMLHFFQLLIMYNVKSANK